MATSFIKKKKASRNIQPKKIHRKHKKIRTKVYLSQKKKKQNQIKNDSRPVAKLTANSIY